MLNFAKELLAISERHGTISKFRFSDKAENKWDDERVRIFGSFDDGTEFELTLSVKDPEVYADAS